MDDTARRDRLAVDRTILANERTLLAYLRTMLGLLAAGGSLMHFIDATWAMAAGALLVAFGPALFAFGVWRFRRVHRDLAARRDA